MHICLSDNLDFLDQIKPQWQELQSRITDNTTAGCSWEFISTFVHTTKPSSWFFAAIYDDQGMETLRGLFPLQTLRIEADNQTIFICRTLACRMHAYWEYLIDSQYREEILAALITALREILGCEAINLGPFHEDSKTYLCFLEYAVQLNIKITKAPAIPYIDTRGLDFDAFMQTRSSRTSVDYSLRKLTQQAELKFSINTGPIHEEVHHVALQHEQKFAAQHIMRTVPNWLKFLTELSKRHYDSGLLELSTLRHNGTTIASHFGFLCKGRRYYYMPCYNEHYSKYSPSKILIYYLIKQTFSEKGIFCFGGGIYPYKLDWCQAVAEAKLIWIFLNKRARKILDPYTTWQKHGLFI